jgi:hypothetical protein
VPVESLWPEGGAVRNEHELAVLLEVIAGYDVTRAKAIEAANVPLRW